MIALDVNVLVAAFHSSSPDHVAMRTYLEACVNGREQVGISSAVAVGVVRVLTHPRVFDPPATSDEALGLVGQLLAHPRVTTIDPGQRHWELFDELCRKAAAQGDLVPDASHAATAIEHDATFVTRDRDFARFAGLRWRHPS